MFLHKVSNSEARDVTHVLFIEHELDLLVGKYQPEQVPLIVVIGAASSMGLETSRYFASKGAILSLADVQEKPLEDLEVELQQSGTQVITAVVDVRNRKAVDDWITSTDDKFGKLVGAANLAGVISRQHNHASIAEIDDDDWDFVFGVNTKGLMSCLRAQVPSFNDGGSIVNATIVSGLIGSKNNTAYVASKHAVVGMTRALAKELGERNIRVNCSTHRLLLTQAC